MSYLPCKNPNCNSYGKPHPNCRCYGEMAEGGEAHFCATARMHEGGCVYFKDGGEADAPDFIPDGGEAEAPDFIPDASAPPAAAAAAPESAPDFIPDDTADAKPEAQDEAPDFIPDEPQAPAPVPGQRLTDDEIKQNAAATNDAYQWAPVVAGLPPVAQGAAFLNGAIQNGLIQGASEVDRWLLGQGNPEHPVGAALARIGAAGLLGGAVGKLASGAQSGVTKGAQAAAELKFGQRAEYFLYGLAAGEKPVSADKLPEAAAKGYKLGQKLYGYISGKMVGPTAGAAVEGAVGFKRNGLEGAWEGVKSGVVDGIMLSLAGKVGAKAAKIVTPTLLKVAGSGVFTSVSGALDHAIDVAAGSSLVNKGVEHLLKGSGLGLQLSYGSPATRKKISDFLDEGGANQSVRNSAEDGIEGYAKGGEVIAPKPHDETIGHNPGLAAHYPQQNMLMNMAKGRVANYLNSLRPATIHQKLAFDEAPDTTEQKRRYEKALDLAGTPLGILHEVHKGTITPDHVTHFNAMYPEVNALLQKQLTEGITKAQMKGEKPPYMIRQGLSMLMGTALSGDVTPANITAAQSVFAAAAQKRPDQSQPPPKSKTNTLSKSDQAYLTGDQAREQRMQKAK